MPGFPDWQRGAPTMDLLNAPGGGYPVGTTDTPVIPATTPSLFVRFAQITAGSAKVTVRRFLDAAGTQQVGTDTWAVNANEGLAVIAPLLAAYFNIRVVNSSGVTMTGVFSALGVHQSVPAPIYPVTQNTIAVSNRNLGVGLTDFWYPTRIQKGLAFFQFVPHDGAAQLHAQVIRQTELGAFVSVMFDALTPAAAIDRLICLTDDLLAVQVTNNDGVAAHAYDVYLNPGNLD